MQTTTADRPIDRAFMDEAARPTDDFYRYAVGRWLDATKIPEDQPAWGGFAELHQRNQELLHDILARAASAPESDVARQVGDLYASGMDEAAIGAAGLAGVRALLADVDALQDASALPRLVATLHTYKVAAPFAVRVLPDAFDSVRNIVHVAQAGLGLPDRDYYLRTDEKSVELQKRYREHVATMLRLLGAPDGDAGRAADAIYDLERELAVASMPRVEQRDPYKVNNATTREQLAARTPSFDWDAYLSAIGAGAVRDLNVRQPGFLDGLETLVRERPVALWRTYLRWHVVRSFAPYLPRDLERASFEFFTKTLLGQPEEKPRWKRVLAVVDAQLPHPIGRLFVERAFPPSAKQRILDLVADLRAVLADRIATLEWMGDETRKAARGKLDAFGVKMGYPDRWRDFSGLRIDRGPYVDNVMRATAFEFAYDIAKLGRPVDRDEWLMSAPTVNAYYYPPRNEIVFPAGILQPPFFFPEADAAVNYGAIGAVIGHEMTHGFDDAGSQFDAQGNLRNWWQPSDRTAYESRTDLVVKQYEEYEPLPGMRINGRLCLGENIADLGGLKIAYAAFERYLAKHGEPAPIDGLTARQRFFLGYAQAWRSLMRDETMRVRLTIDPHSPARYRVLGPLANLPEFFAAFGGTGTMERPEALRPAIW